MILQCPFLRKIPPALKSIMHVTKSVEYISEPVSYEINLLGNKDDKELPDNKDS